MKVAYYQSNLSLKKIAAAFFVEDFEKKVQKFFQNMTGKKYILLTGSCRAALFLTYKSLGVDNIVLTTPLTCTAGLDPIKFSDNRPFYSDISVADLNMDVRLLDNINQKINIIQIVHIGGFPVDMKKVIDFAKKHNIIIIEDCAQAFTAKYEDQFVGSFGDVACFSLIKNAYSIGGGILATNNKAIYQKAAKMQNDFELMDYKIVIFRILRALLESYRDITAFEKLYLLLMDKKLAHKKQRAKNLRENFLSSLNQPRSIFFKLFLEQTTSLKKLHGLRKQNAFEMINFLKFHNSIQNYPDQVFEKIDPSFTKLMVVLNAFNSAADIERLNQEGLEFKHLEHKHNSFYQQRLDQLPYLYDNSIENCHNYFRVYDHLISLPLFEKMSHNDKESVLHATMSFQRQSLQ